MNAEITVVVQDDRTVRARNQDGAQASGKVEVDRLHRDLINLFGDWLSRRLISRRRELEAFGSLLYRTIFAGEVEGFFERTHASLPPGERLRVQLSFQDGSAELAALPWEYLYCPDSETRRGFFLSTDVGLVLSRYMPLGKGRQNLAPAESPLRVLMVVSKPKELGPVIDGPVIEAVKQLADVQIDVLDMPTVGEYLDALREKRPHVLHYIGHSRFNKAEMQGEIALLGPDYESVQWVRDREFTEFFAQMGVKPRLVFLQSCEGAAVDFAANFAGLAPQLIRAEIPAVAAMQYPITNKAAISFSRAFYRELANGAPVDHAAQVGRWRITVDDPDAYNTGAFGIPVLYLHSRDGIIRSEPGAPVKE